MPQTQYQIYLTFQMGVSPTLRTLDITVLLFKEAWPPWQLAAQFSWPFIPVVGPISRDSLLA